MIPKKAIGLLMVLTLLKPAIAQFDGGAGDGHYSSGLTGVRIDGNLLSNIVLFTGGDGDGFTATISSTSLLNNSLLLYAGGAGDGHAALSTSSALTNINITALYAGGAGDGFAVIKDSPLLNGAVVAVVYGGGDGDGFSAISEETSLTFGPTLVLYSGGDGDGFAENTNSGLLMGNLIAVLFGGGDGDGNSVVLASAQTLNGQLMNIYGGGSGDGSMMAAFDGLLLQALPVEWISFDAVQQGSVVLLTWSTATEIKNERFEIERSIGEIDFESIGTMPGAGTTDEQQDYRFIDSEPDVGILYYRIKQVDYDGQFSYSEVRSLLIEDAGEIDVSFYPNPNRDRVLNLKTQGIASGSKVKVVVFDQRGRRLKQWQVTSDQQINLPWNWGSGLYKVMITVEDKTITKSLVIID
ncbi:MAG: T9SS type A sorting domain-containing protein [Bacteroidota bacterium]